MRSVILPNQHHRGIGFKLQNMSAERPARLRLAFVINGSKNGHLQMQFLSYARSLVIYHDISILFIFSVNHESAMVREFKSLGVDVASLGCKNPVGLRSVFRTYKYFLTTRPQVIHSQHPIAGVNAKVAGWLYRLRFRDAKIICEQRNEPQGLSRFARWLEYLTFPAADLILCSSTRVEKNYFGSSKVFCLKDFDFKARKHYTFFNSIDLDVFALSMVDKRSARALLKREWDIGERDFLVVTIAKFERQKDYATLIHAFARARHSVGEKNLKLVCIGDGREIMSVRCLVEALGLGEHVVLPGFREDVTQILCGADCFVLTSLWEGLPKSLLEAMSVPLPCVATMVAGTEDVLQDGVDGLLIPPGDVGACAQALIRLAMEPALGRVLASNARRRVNLFSSREQARVLDRIYQNLYSQSV